MDITPKSGVTTAGVAYSNYQTINAAPDPFITGNVPALLTTSETIAADIVLPEHSVVGFDDAGHIVEAEKDVTAAIGILVYPVDTTGQAAGSAVAAVYRGGCFNPDLISWPASYASETDMLKAFEGAPSPSTIIIRRPTAMTV